MQGASSKVEGRAGGIVLSPRRDLWGSGRGRADGDVSLVICLGDVSIEGREGRAWGDGKVG